MISKNKTSGRIAISPYFITMLLGICALLIVAAIIASPEEAFQASMQGLDVWWKVVFPALLPFLMLSQMLTAYGFTHGLGVLLDPLMRKMFRIPGPSGVGLAVGMSAGFPSGADTAVQLYRQKLITAKEVSRLASLTHFANPMTLLVVIGAAFYQNPIVGYVLILVHWASGIASGFILARFAGRNEVILTSTLESKTEIVPKTAMLHSMLQTASIAREKDGRSFGKLLGDTVSHAVQVLMMTGGAMIVFSVTIKLIGKYITPFFPDYIWSSFFEIHLGAYALRSTEIISSPLHFGLLAAAIGWGGLSSHWQVSALLKPYGISTSTFTFGRVLHACISYILVLMLWKPIQLWLESNKTVFGEFNIGSQGLTEPAMNGFELAGMLGMFLILLLMTFIFLSRWIVRWQSTRGPSSR
ncbi:nucleoside recognition domain-containing protein [Paenibacillus sp. Marseille-Q4541]|uniref:nucleoside recognition domain-containing protein n=1 Tax=Paenibacillus sp. Marseille-Q4541 TaxID=2831522 RepID=UPI001BADE93F|nr:nucleoside recognition domain-containing protein [Paenibacillus sp. Marseille-Q4541]